MNRSSLVLLLFSFGAVRGLSSCVTAYEKTVGGDSDRVYEQVYKVDYHEMWTALGTALKEFPVETKNREAGLIVTKWVDNTSSKNFRDSYGATNAYIKAKYRLRLAVSKGFFEGLPSVQLSIQKEQLIQTDALDAFHLQPTEGIEEKSLVYRIGRVLWMQRELEQMEVRRRERELRGQGEESLQ